MFEDSIWNGIWGVIGLVALVVVVALAVVGALLLWIRRDIAVVGADVMALHRRLDAILQKHDHDWRPTGAVQPAGTGWRVERRCRTCGAVEWGTDAE